MADPSSTPTTITFVDEKTFTISGDATAACHVGRRVKVKRTALASIHGTISSSSLNAGITTVILTADSEDLDANCVGIWIAQMSGPGGYSSLPVHPHENENSGGNTLENDFDAGSWS
jgi:hypothetical protein